MLKKCYSNLVKKNNIENQPTSLKFTQKVKLFFLILLIGLLNFSHICLDLMLKYLKFNLAEDITW